MGGVRNAGMPGRQEDRPLRKMFLWAKRRAVFVVYMGEGAL